MKTLIALLLAQAFVFHSADVQLVVEKKCTGYQTCVGCSDKILIEEHAISNKLPLAITKQIFKYGDYGSTNRHWGIWADNAYPTVVLEDGDYITIKEGIITVVKHRK